MDDGIILNLKAKGKSLRQIVSAFGISHETVRKRMKDLQGKNQVSPGTGDEKLTATTIENRKVSNSSNAHQSRASEKAMDTVNQVSTQETPSLSPSTGVNPFKTLSLKPTEGKKGVSQGVDSESGDLFERIKFFLEANGIEVYRMQGETEAYQVKHNGQTIRFYVFR